MRGKKSERIVMQRKWFRQEFVICGENDSWWLPCVPHNTNCAIESSQMKVCKHTIPYHRWRYANIPYHIIPQMKVCKHTEPYHRWKYAHRDGIWIFFSLADSPAFSLLIYRVFNPGQLDRLWLVAIWSFLVTGCFILNSCFLLPFCYFAGHSFLLLKKSQILVFFGLTFIFWISRLEFYILQVIVRPIFVNSSSRLLCI